MESRAVLSETLSPLRQRASPGMASGPKWPWPGMSDMKLLVNGSYLRCGPRKHVALLVEPCPQNGKARVSKTSACAREKEWFKSRNVYLRDEVLVLGGLHVLAVVHLLEVEQRAVRLEHGVASREGVVRLRAVDLPRQQARGHAHHRVELAVLKLALPGGEGEHRGVAVGHVVVKGQARLDVLARGLRAEAAILVPRKPAHVAARHVAGARHVAHDHDVLGLGDHGLEVARVVTLDGLDLGVGRELHVGRAEQRGARVAARDREDRVVHQVLDEGARHHDAAVEHSVVPPAARALGVRGPVLGLGLPRGGVAAAGHGLDALAAHVATGGHERGLERVAPGDAHVAVALLVVDEQVARELAVGRLDLRRRHDVELADLARAREHLHRVGIVADFKGLGRHDAAAAERARLEPGHARLEARLGRGAALLVGCAGERESGREQREGRRGQGKALVLSRIWAH